jgi:hypothetical protein
MTAISIRLRLCPVLASCLVFLALGLILVSLPAAGQDQDSASTRAADRSSLPVAPAPAVPAAPAGEAGEPAAAPPRIVFDSLSYNAGTVEKGEKVTHTFTFRNEGGSELVILSTKAG